MEVNINSLGSKALTINIQCLRNWHCSSPVLYHSPVKVAYGNTTGVLSYPSIISDADYTRESLKVSWWVVM